MPICLAQEADMSVLVQQELIKQVAGTPATVALKYTMRPKERTMAAKLPVMHLLCKHHHQAPSSSTIITRNKKTSLPGQLSNSVHPKMYATHQAPHNNSTITAEVLMPHVLQVLQASKQTNCHTQNAAATTD